MKLGLCGHHVHIVRPLTQAKHGARASRAKKRELTRTAEPRCVYCGIMGPSAKTLIRKKHVFAKDTPFRIINGELCCVKHRRRGAQGQARKETEDAQRAEVERRSAAALEMRAKQLELQKQERRLTHARADLEAERNALSLEQRRLGRKKESLVHEVTVRSKQITAKMKDDANRALREKAVHLQKEAQEAERRLTHARADLEAERNALSLEHRRLGRKKERLVQEATVRSEHIAKQITAKMKDDANRALREKAVHLQKEAQKQERRLTHARADLEAERNALSLRKRRLERRQRVAQDTSAIDMERMSAKIKKDGDRVLRAKEREAQKKLEAQRAALGVEEARLESAFVLEFASTSEQLVEELLVNDRQNVQIIERLQKQTKKVQRLNTNARKRAYYHLRKKTEYRKYSATVRKRLNSYINGKCDIDDVLTFDGEATINAEAEAMLRRPWVASKLREIKATTPSGRFTDQVRLWCYHLLGAGVSSRKCGDLLQSILAGLGMKLERVPSASTVRKILAPEVHALDNGQVSHELLKQPKHAACLMEDEASKLGKQRLTTALAMTEGGVPGAPVHVHVMQVVDLYGGLAQDNVEATRYAFRNLARQFNQIVETRVRHRRDLGEAISVEEEDEQKVTETTLLEFCGSTQTDGCATQRSANKAILAMFANAAAEMQHMDTDAPDDMNVERYCSFYCFLHIAMNMVGAFDRGLASADQDDILARIQREQAEQDDVYMITRAKDKLSEKVGVGAAGVWTCTKLWSDMSRNEQVSRGCEYTLHLENAFEKRASPLPDSFKLHPWRALLGNRQIARCSNARRIWQMIVDPVIGASYCRKCCASKRYAKVKEHVAPESWEATPDTAAYCVICFTCAKEDKDGRAKPLNLLDRGAILFLLDARFVAHLVCYAFAEIAVVMPMVRATAKMRAMDCLALANTYNIGLQSLREDPMPYVRDEQRVLCDDVVVELNITSADSDVRRVGQEAIYTTDALHVAQRAMERADSGDDNLDASTARWWTLIVRMTAFHSARDKVHARVSAYVHAHLQVPAPFVVQLTLHRPTRINFLAQLASERIECVNARIQSAAEQAATTFARQAAEYLCYHRQCERNGDVYRARMRRMYSAVPATAAASESILGMVDYHTRTRWFQRTMHASTLAKVQQNRTLANHMQLQQMDRAEAGVHMEAARSGGRLISVLEMQRRDAIRVAKKERIVAKRKKREERDERKRRAQEELVSRKLVLDASLIKNVGGHYNIPGLSAGEIGKQIRSYKAWTLNCGAQHAWAANVSFDVQTKSMPHPSGKRVGPKDLNCATLLAIVKALPTNQVDALRSMGREYVPHVDCKKRKRTSGSSTLADEGDEGLDESDESDEEDGDEDVEYDVDELLEKRGIDGGVEYKVRWLDYGPEYDTWEPAESLPSTPFADGMTLIERFEAKDDGSVNALNERQRELLFANVDSEPNGELSAPEAWARLVLECARRVGRTEANSVRYVCAQAVETQMDAINIDEVLRVEKSDVSMQRKYDSIAPLIDAGLASAVLQPARLQIRHTLAKAALSAVKGSYKIQRDASVNYANVMS